MEQVVAKASGGRSSSNDPMLGKVVAGRYRLEARLGEGGMGVVYRARHVLIERVVALKLIRPDLRGETHLRAWMLREAPCRSRAASTSSSRCARRSRALTTSASCTAISRATTSS